MANNPKNRRRTIGRTVMLAAALAVLSSLVLTVSAAGLLTDIIAKFAPAKKPSDTLSEIYGTAVSTEAPHDPGLLTIDDCTFSVEGSFPVGPNTVTLKDFAMNGMGIGVLTFTVENPDGVGFTLSEDGALTLSGDLQAPRFFVDKDAPLGDNAAVTQLRLIREEDTLLDLVMYFGFQDIPFYGTPMYLEFTSTGTGEQTTVEVSPPAAEGNYGLLGTDGRSIVICSQGLYFVWKESTPLTPESITIHFKDGSTYQVLDKAADVDHTLFDFWRTTTILQEDGSYGIGNYEDCVMLFDRIIDPLQVSHITASYSWTDPEDTVDYTATYHH